ncbi:MAG: cytochrome-c peroxidase [Chloroflexi bacterium HGW-Chloroflexi-2]|jgi:cytochrome c peroxidase|nr:MAG: cytochrome-c peroxidase [Chloroflexi bacterium HGW-Chloroflexi-2]
MKLKSILLLGIVLLAVVVSLWMILQQPRWTEEEIITLRNLWIGSLPALPPDPSNVFADDPQSALLGQKLFFDTRFSSSNQVSCATCHKPELMFTDGLPLSIGVGTTDRKSMTIIGTAYSPWQFWDGRKDSQWAQALAPLESVVEHGGTRMQYAHLIANHYQEEYEAIFGPLPDFSDPVRFPAIAGPVDDPDAQAAWEGMTSTDRDLVTQVFVNMGKAIAAYERLILPAPSRFDRYVEALLKNDEQTMKSAMTSDEVAGLKLFIGRADCIQCHNGPLLTNNDFHNTGVPTRAGLPLDNGRAMGVMKVLNDEFNCLSQWSDAEEMDCSELRFVVSEGEQLEAAFKPSTLRNIAETAPYMHAGQFATLEEVLRHYNHPPLSPAGHNELEPLGLTNREMAQIIAFLNTLSGGVDAPPELLKAPLNN